VEAVIHLFHSAKVDQLCDCEHTLSLTFAANKNMGSIPGIL